MNNIRFMEIAPDQKHELRMDAQSHFGTFEIKDDATLKRKIRDLSKTTYCGDQANVAPVNSNKFIYTSGYKPTITEEGIAYDFASSQDPQHLDYAKSVRILKSLNATKPICIKGDFLLNNVTTSYEAIISLCSANVNCFYELRKADSNTGINIVYSTSSTERAAITVTGKVELGKHYFYEINFDGTDAKLYLGEDKDNLTLIHTCQPAPITIDNIKIGVSYGYGIPFRGKIDLKQIEVKNGDEYIFRGNKTGIDTIKPSNFTAITSSSSSPFVNPSLPFSDNGLTISDDGVASGFSGSNYLQTSTISLSNNFSIYFPFTLTDTHYGYVLYGGQDKYLFIANWDDGYLKFRVGDGSNWQDLISSNFKPSLNTKYYLCFEYKNGSYNLKLYQNNDWQIIATMSSQTQIIPDNAILLGIDYARYNKFYGSIDLNTFKIYVNGDLVYQPCLKIPYTEGQNYVKVVDKLYRDRVKDLFEQKGYNGYYTIGEDDFTLPSNKWSDVVEHKENGLTVAEQRVDQTLTIRGACEQGVDVNLPMEFFSDDSYSVFGVGTTGTNTASKFTPAADGNYIAIGKGKV